MMGKLQEIEDSMDHDIREIWFKNNVAELDSDTLRWHIPGSSLYSVHYIIKGSNLIVLGDIGAAIYRWNSPISFEFVAGCNIGYFFEKCEAAFEGARGMEWDEDVAWEKLECYFNDYFEDKPEQFEKFKKKYVGACESRFEWHRFLDRWGYDKLGNNYYEYGNVGDLYPIRARGHLIGLQMAVEHLNIAKQKELEAL